MRAIIFYDLVQINITYSNGPIFLSLSQRIKTLLYIYFLEIDYYNSNIKKEFYKYALTCDFLVLRDLSRETKSLSGSKVMIENS